MTITGRFGSKISWAFTSERRGRTYIEWTLEELPSEDLPIEAWRSLREAFEADAHVFWERAKEGFDPDFVEFMDAVVWGADDIN